MARVTLPIACAINSEYALPLLVMLTSLKEHLRASYQPLLYLVHPGLGAGPLAAISQLTETVSIVPSPEIVAAIPKHSHFPPEAAYPLVLANVLPQELDRILFLDADTLVLDDLAELWEIPIGDSLLGAAPDSAIPLCCSPRGVKAREELGIPDNAVYFNCGVMLIDLALWRQREVTRRRLRLFAEGGSRSGFSSSRSFQRSPLGRLVSAGEPLECVGELWPAVPTVDRNWMAGGTLVSSISQAVSSRGALQQEGFLIGNMVSSYLKRYSGSPRATPL